MTGRTKTIVSGKDKDEESLKNDPEYKRRLGSKRYNFPDFDPRKSMGTCMLCGKYKQVFNLSGSFHVCPRHEARIRLNGGITRRIGMSLSGIKCHLCDKKEFYNAYSVNGGKLCTKCQWKKLAKKKHVMKVGDTKSW